MHSTLLHASFVDVDYLCKAVALCKDMHCVSCHVHSAPLSLAYDRRMQHHFVTYEGELSETSRRYPAFISFDHSLYDLNVVFCDLCPVFCLRASFAITAFRRLLFAFPFTIQSFCFLCIVSSRFRCLFDTFFFDCDCGCGGDGVVGRGNIYPVPRIVGIFSNAGNVGISSTMAGAAGK